MGSCFHRNRFLSDLTISLVTATTTENRTSRLVKLLVGKLLFDLFFLIAAVVVSAYIALPPMYRGWTDEADSTHVSGWVADQLNNARKVDVQLFVDGKFIAERTADMPRPDVTQKYPTVNAACGFRFEMPQMSAGVHAVNVYAVEISKPGSPPTVLQVGKTMSVKIE